MVPLFHIHITSSKFSPCFCPLGTTSAGRESSVCVVYIIVDPSIFFYLNSSPPLHTTHLLLHSCCLNLPDRRASCVKEHSRISALKFTFPFFFSLYFALTNIHLTVSLIHLCFFFFYVCVCVCLCFYVGFFFILAIFFFFSVPLPFHYCMIFATSFWVFACCLIDSSWMRSYFTLPVDFFV